MSLLRERDWNKPYLVTRSWIEEASRIKRRVTTNGGNDRSLVQYVIKSLAKRPEFVARMDESIEGGALSWEDIIESDLERKCMFQGETFHFYWSAHFSSERSDYFEHLISRELPSILRQLELAPEASWKRTLSEIVPEVIELLYMPHEAQNCPVLTLELASDHHLWNLICQIKG
jgi:hypothetical protein